MLRILKILAAWVALSAGVQDVIASVPSFSLAILDWDGSVRRCSSQFIAESGVLITAAHCIAKAKHNFDAFPLYQSMGYLRQPGPAGWLGLVYKSRDTEFTPKISISVGTAFGKEQYFQSAHVIAVGSIFSNQSIPDPWKAESWTPSEWDEVGTGLEDFAVLRLTRVRQNYPCIRMAGGESRRESSKELLLAGYPSGQTKVVTQLGKKFDPAESVFEDINTTHAWGVWNKFYNSNTTFMVHGSLGYGSSGGAVLNAEGELEGIISFVTDTQWMWEGEVKPLTGAFSIERLKERLEAIDPHLIVQNENECGT